MRKFVSIAVGAAVVAGCSAGLARAAGPPANAVPPLSVESAPVPADAMPSGPVTLSAMSCGAPGFCVAVGTYTDNTPRIEGLVETYSGGTWHAMRAPIPAGTASNPVNYPSQVSCAGTTCAVYGIWNGSTQYFATLSGGHWSAKIMPLPADDIVAYGGGETALACEPSGRCFAVGNYFRSGGGFWGFVDAMTVSGGVAHWSSVVAPTPATPPVFPPGNPGAPSTESQLTSISCRGTGSCIAVGSYSADDGTGGYTWQGLIETISNGTTNGSWQTPVAGEANNNWTAQLFQIGCGHGSCVAAGQYTVTGQTAPVLDTWAGSGGASPSVPPWPAGAGKTQDGLNLYAMACGAKGSCVIVGQYEPVSGFNLPVIDTLSSKGWSSMAAPLPPKYVGARVLLGAVSCATSDSCLAAATSPLSLPPSPTDLLESLSGGKWTAIQVPRPGNVGVVLNQYVGVGCDAPQHCFAITGDGLIVTVGARPSSPKLTLKTPAAPFTLTSSTSVSWAGSDAGAKISHYTVQERRAAWNGGFTSWTTPPGWASLPAGTTHVTAPLSVGYDSCFRVEAVDSRGHSAWSATRCTAMPVDDRSLTASSGWARRKGSAFYRNTYTSTTHLGAKLTITGAKFDRLALVATECPSCGKVGLYSGSTLLGTFNLAHSTTAHKVIFSLPPASLRSGTITIKVLSSGKLVQIDGLGISRS